MGNFPKKNFFSWNWFSIYFHKIFAMTFQNFWPSLEYFSIYESYIISIPNDPSGSCRGSFQVSIAMIYLTITLKASLTPSPFFAEVLNHFGMKLYSWTILEISKSVGSLGSLGRSDLLQTKSTGIFLPPGIRTFSSISAFHFSKAAWNVRTSV